MPVNQMPFFGLMAIHQHPCRARRACRVDRPVLGVPAVLIGLPVVFNPHGCILCGASINPYSLHVDPFLPSFWSNAPLPF